MRWCCAVLRASIIQRSGGRLWNVLQFRCVGRSCRARISLRSHYQLYYLPVVKLLWTREEEAFRSDNQEQGHIDGTGEVEHRGSEKRSRRRYMMVSEQPPPCDAERKDDEGVRQGIP